MYQAEPRHNIIYLCYSTTNPSPIPGFGSDLIARVILSLPHLQYCSCHLLGFGQLLQFSTVYTHTKLRTGTLAVWRKPHSSCPDTGSTCMSFVCSYQCHSRTGCFFSLYEQVYNNLQLPIEETASSPSSSRCLLLPMLSIWNSSSWPGAVIKWCFSAHLIVLKWQMGFDSSW